MTEEKRLSEGGKVSRRTFLKGAGVTVAAAGITPSVTTPLLGEENKVRVIGPDPVSARLVVNGQPKTIEVQPSSTLLDTLRDQLDLTGAKRVCDRGSCGACMVLVDGKPMNSCTLLAVDANEKEITTIEGVASEGELSRLQKEFVECDALQCGYCTPGMVVTLTALLREKPRPTHDEVAGAIAGNLCRCGTYQNIFEAVERACGRKERRAF